VSLVYSNFVHPRYPQDGPEFTAGLSAIDAVFRLGWTATGSLIRTASADTDRT